MNKSFTIVKKGKMKKNIFKPHLPIDYDEFVSLVEKCEWLTWHEKMDFGRYLFENNPDLPKKKIAFFNLDKSKQIQIIYSDFWCSLWFEKSLMYDEIKLGFQFANCLDCNLWDDNTSELITESYLEALRIKEENRGIKLTKEQRHVLDNIEDQCRWFYIPTDDVYKVLNIFGIQPNIKDGDITSIIDDVQREKTIAIATFTGHTIIFGCNVPYIAFPGMQTYLAKEDHHTTHLQEVLNKLSKAFGIAAYFEYNNDDELIASLAWSSKGKFVYGRFTSEGEGHDIFGTQKKTMDVNQKSIIKTAKKLGMTPEDILTGILKQKINVQYFEQPNWYIESRLKNLK
jgi:hypothetical protein